MIFMQAGKLKLDSFGLWLARLSALVQSLRHMGTLRKLVKSDERHTEFIVID